MVTQSRSCLVRRPSPSGGGGAGPAPARRRAAGGQRGGGSERARARRPEPCRKGCAGMPVDLGKVGIWSRELRFNPDRGARTAAAAELEELGYSAIFIPDVG